MTTRHAVCDTRLGQITIVASGHVITGLYFAEHARRPRTAALGARVATSEDQLLMTAERQLREYLAGSRRDFDLPIEAVGDAFHKAVWALVCELSFGQTTTYGALAERLGDRALAQEVGRAVGANPLCILVPCHRVVGATGALTGYAGGLTRKRILLELEEPAAVGAERLF